jgi:hypothetical protein
MSSNDRKRFQALPSAVLELKTAYHDKTLYKTNSFFAKQKEQTGVSRNN